jgi:hypothetical protein
MQSRLTAQLAKKLRTEHALNNSWEVTARLCNVLTEDGRPDKGLAFLIAMRGFEPTRKETRARLGLKRKPVQREKRMADMSINELRWAFENRVEMKLT